MLDNQLAGLMLGVDAAALLKAVDPMCAIVLYSADAPDRPVDGVDVSVPQEHASGRPEAAILARR